VSPEVAQADHQRNGEIIRLCMGGKVSDLKGKLAAIFSKNFNSFVVPFVSCVVVGPI